MGSVLVNGAVAGCVYGLLALGLVIVYKATKVFNFAHAEIGTFAAFATYLAFDHVSIWFACLVGLAVAAVAGILIDVTIVRSLRNSPPVTLIVATLGVATFTIACEAILAGDQPRTIPALITGSSVSILGVGVTRQQLLTVGVAVLLVVLLTLFFNRTRFGRTFVATSEDPMAARLCGVPVKYVGLVTWGFAGALAALCGILVAPSQFITPGFMTYGALVQGFAAAVIGGMTNLQGAFIGGILVGIAEAAAYRYLPGALPSASTVGVFVILLAVMLFKPEGLFTRSKWFAR